MRRTRAVQSVGVDDRLIHKDESPNVFPICRHISMFLPKQRIRSSLFNGVNCHSSALLGRLVVSRSDFDGSDPVDQQSYYLLLIGQAGSVDFVFFNFILIEV